MFRFQIAENSRSVQFCYSSLEDSETWGDGCRKIGNAMPRKRCKIFQIDFTRPLDQSSSQMRRAKTGYQRAISLIIIAIFWCITASADVLYTTFGPGNQYDGTNGWFVDGRNFINQSVANPFTLASGVTITDAVLALGNYAGGNGPVVVLIMSNQGGLPGTILAELTQVGTIPSWFNGKGGGLVTFNCIGVDCTLSAGSYWLAAVETDPSTRQVWDLAYQDAQTKLAFTNDFIQGWGDCFCPGDAFRLDGSISRNVPEPAPLILFGSCLSGIAACRRRRSRCPKPKVCERQ